MEAAINIKSVIQAPGEDSNVMELYSDGEYIYKNGTSRLRYTETELTGLAGTETEVCITGEGVRISRKGSLTTVMDFREGEKSSFLIETPYGTATMGMETRQILASFDESGGELVIKYVLNIEHAVCSVNRLIINVKLRS